MSKRPIVVFGGLGGGALVAQSIHALAASGQRVTLLGFLNDRLVRGELVSGTPVLGAFSHWRELADDVGFVAPLHKVKEMPARVRTVGSLRVPAQRWATIIDPRSAIASDAVIGHGCFVGPFATVGPGARVGCHSVVRAGAHVSHDCTVGDFAFIGTNAVVCGYAVLGDGAYVAPNATIRDGCRVGAFSIVGLGSVVIKDVADFAVVAGAPARDTGSPENPPTLSA